MNAISEFKTRIIDKQGETIREKDEIIMQLTNQLELTRRVQALKVQYVKHIIARAEEGMCHVDEPVLRNILEALS